MKWMKQPCQLQQGGGDGVIIVKDAAQGALSNPQVHGRLPVTMTGSLDSVLWSDYPTNTVLRDPNTWSQQEKEVVGRAFHWALCNL